MVTAYTQSVLFSLFLYLYYAGNTKKKTKEYFNIKKQYMCFIKGSRNRN